MSFPFLINKSSEVSFSALLLDFDDSSKKGKKSKKKLTNFFDDKPSDEEDDNAQFPRNANPEDDDDESDASDIDMEITWQPGLKG